jgi:hypothetical protein
MRGTDTLPVLCTVCSTINTVRSGKHSKVSNLNTEKCLLWRVNWVSALVGRAGDQSKLIETHLVSLLARVYGTRGDVLDVEPEVLPRVPDLRVWGLGKARGSLV